MLTNLLIQQIILGAAQGITEWLPVSSEGMILLIKTSIFHNHGTFEELVGEALFLHLGSVLAAIIYFRTEITRLLLSLKNINDKNEPLRPLLFFLVMTTLITGLLGIFLLKTVSGIISQWPNATRQMSFIIGCCLLVTGILQMVKKTLGTRITKDLNTKDSLILGIVQGLAVMPGFSRSGLTMSALLFRKFGATQAIRLSFLMSIPVVLAGNIVLNLGESNFQFEHVIGLIASFIFSLFTIDVLLKIARKINFGIFVFLIGILVILSAVLPS